MQKEVLVKKENGTIVQKAATKKRDAMEEVVKEEEFDDGDISRTVRRVSKRTRVKASKS